MFCYMDVMLINCIVWGNSAGSGDDINFDRATLRNTCSSDGVTHGNNGCITNDPLFVATNDFRLLPASPCIDAGTNAYVQGGTDFKGNARIVNGIVDMGAYEYDRSVYDTG